jgi:hypothetical protein
VLGRLENFSDEFVALLGRQSVSRDSTAGQE